MKNEKKKYCKVQNYKQKETITVNQIVFYYYLGFVNAFL
jgi:hypothetical protein